MVKEKLVSSPFTQNKEELEEKDKTADKRDNVAIDLGKNLLYTLFALIGLCLAFVCVSSIWKIDIGLKLFDSIVVKVLIPLVTFLFGYYFRR